MNSSTLHIIKLWLWLSFSSIFYFCFLIIHIPIPAAITLSATFGILLFYKRQKVTGNNNPFVITIAAIGSYLLINKSLNLAEKYGLWDAWAIWNLHASYLVSPDNWKAMFNNGNGAHPDYPLALPSILAHFKYLLPNSSYWIAAFGFHLFTTLTIPILIYAETYKKNLIIATIAMLVLCTNTHYIYIGISQLADTLLSLFFLIALVTINNTKSNPKLILFAAVFTGLCMWTKNEGIIFSGFILLFHFKLFFNRQNRKLSILGLSISILLLLIYKTLYATPNDIMSAERQPLWALLTDSERNRMIYDSFVKNLNLYFRSIQYAVILFLLLVITKRKNIQAKQLIMILCILISLMSAYVISPHDLGWHLATSQSRLMLQVFPAFVYVLAINFAEHATLTLPKVLLSRKRRPL